jgi:hypothetical protein
MNDADIADLVQKLEYRYGLGLLSSKRKTQDGWILSLNPKDLHPAEGFCIDILVGWHSILTRFIPGNLSGDLVKVACPPKTDPTFVLGFREGDRSKCHERATASNRSLAS